LAVLIIYSKKHALQLAIEEGPEAAYRYLETKFRKLKAESTRDTPEWKELLELAAKLARKSSRWIRTNIFDLLMEIGDRDVMKQYFIKRGKRNSTSPNELNDLEKAKEKFGWDPVLVYLIAGGGNSTISILNKHLSDLPSMNDVEKGQLQTILEGEVQKFITPQDHYYYYGSSESRCLELVRLLTALPILDLQVYISYFVKERNNIIVDISS